MTSAPHPHHIPLHRHLVVRQIRARPRLFLSMLLAAGTFVLLPASVASHTATRLLLVWNVGVSLYLLLAGSMIVRASHEHIRWRARIQDEGRLVVLIGVTLATLACLASIFVELATVKDLHGQIKYEHIGLAVATVLSSWMFIHLMFALHYAHDFYMNKTAGHDGGLQFPGTEQPDYLDFLYFASVIGTSGQTADVSFSSPLMRRTGMLHCVLSYIFNTTVLALTINIASGLL